MVDTTKQGRDLVSFLGMVQDHWCADSWEQFLQFHSEANGNDCYQARSGLWCQR